MGKLYGAASTGTLDEVKKLVEGSFFSKPIPVDAIDNGWRPLHVAVVHNRYEIAEYLLEKGANPNSVCWDYSALSSSIFSSNNLIKDRLPLFKLLLKYGADINWRKADGDTLLHIAVSHGELSIVKYLIQECKFDVNIKNHHGVTPSLIVVRTPNNITPYTWVAVDFLIKNGADYTLKLNGKSVFDIVRDQHKYSEVINQIFKYLTELDESKTNVSSKPAVPTPPAGNVLTSVKSSVAVNTTTITSTPASSHVNTKDAIKTTTATSSSGNLEITVKSPSTANSTTTSSITPTSTANSSGTPAPSVSHIAILSDPKFQTFVTSLSTTNLQVLQAVNTSGADLNQILPVMMTLQSNQQNLTKRLLAVETQMGLDAQTKAEIDYIQSNHHLNRYYKAFKTTLGQTLFAAQVIASSEINAKEGTPTVLANGITKLASGVCPPAAPFLSFVAFVVGVADHRKNLIAMKTLSAWAGLDEMAFIAATLARYFTFALKDQLANGLNTASKNTFLQLTEKCSALLSHIQTGETLSVEERRAILDAREILAYMKDNSRPVGANMQTCVVILLRVIMGDNYIHNSIHIVAKSQQTSTATVTATATIVTQNTQSHVISKDEWEMMQKKAAEAERKAEEAAKNAAQAHKELENIRKKTVESNLGSAHSNDNGDGTMSLQRNALVNTAQGVMPVGAAIELLQRQLAELQGFASTAAPILDHLHGQQQQDKSKAENENDEKLRKDLFQGSGSGKYQTYKTT